MSAGKAGSLSALRHLKPQRKVVGPACASATLHSLTPAKQTSRHVFHDVHHKHGWAAEIHMLEAQRAAIRHPPRNCHSAMGHHRPTPNANSMRQSTPSNSLGSWDSFSLRSWQRHSPESARDKQDSTIQTTSQPPWWLEITYVGKLAPLLTCPSSELLDASAFVQRKSSSDCGVSTLVCDLPCLESRTDEAGQSVLLH